MNLAKEAEVFLNSPLYIYLRDSAKEEAMDAANELLNCDAKNSDHIQKLQNKAALLNQSLFWVNELVQAGENIKEIKLQEMG